MFPEKTLYAAMAERFEDMLTGGHPNSLGRTVEVVHLVLNDTERFEELMSCYRSDDAVVRLRTSNAIKRVEAERHDLLIPYIDRLIGEVGKIDQPSAQWTLAQLFDRLWNDMNEAQRVSALRVMKRNLDEYDDWIVLNTTIETLAKLAHSDDLLAKWLQPRLARLAADHRKSVANRASKKLKALEAR